MFTLSNILSMLCTTEEYVNNGRSVSPQLQACSDYSQTAAKKPDRPSSIDVVHICCYFSYIYIHLILEYNYVCVYSCSADNLS